MSSTISVVGIVPADEKYKLMLDIQKSCQRAGVQIPKDVLAFFNHVEKPCDRGYEIQMAILGCSQYNHPCATQYQGPYSSGIEIDVKKLPENVTHLRFLVS